MTQVCIQPNKTYNTLGTEKRGDVPQSPSPSLTQPTPCSTMLLQRFPVRSGSSNNKTGSSQPRGPGSTSRLLSPAIAGGPRGRSLSASFQRPSGSGTPRPSGSRNSSIRRERSPLGTIPSVQPGSGHSASHTVVDGLSGSGRVVLQTPSEASLDEHITIGVRRRRTDSDDGFDMTQSLSPSQAKKLKMYANQVAEETGCPQEVLHKFIDAGSIFHMLIDLKAASYKRNEDQEKAALLELKELIDSKDFKSALQSRLTACLLSPNITAYVTDTHTNIMEFIKNHREVFKLPAALIQDVELLAQLSKIVSELLSSIRGNLKAKLVASIAKRMSIMDTAKSLAHGIIEVEAGHWNRYAFLRRCLRIFLIGVGDYKAIPLEDLYSTSLEPSLHADLRAKITMALDCEADMDADEDDQQHAERAEDDMDHTNDKGSEGELGVSNEADDDGNLGGGEHAMDNGEEEQNQDEETIQQEPEGNEDDDAGSGFIKGKNGKPPKFTSAKFWNYVDCSLEAVRQAAREEAGPDYAKSARGVYENAVRNILVEYFQMDLVEFPGSMVVPKLLKTTSPQWQTTIQDSLLWG
ncbi:hypothetical protein C8R48DRAFT_768338 [Suillus tomentosus]|nr:hypothetical protein C8R48DRAFT_768338 [Suillus tomentosus]